MNDNKADFALGLLVREQLLHLGVETPFIPQGAIPYEDRYNKIKGHFKGVLDALGMDLTDDSICETPDRMAKMYLQELYAGLDYANFPKCTVVDNKFKYDEMLLERRIKVHSNCEHHGVSFLGFAHVAYIPKSKVLGLSKLNRIVDFFARRPQIQERLTEQIFHALSFILETDNIAICIEAEHMCVKTRGIRDGCSDTVTSKLGGAFKDKPAVRAEFFALVKL